MNDTSFITLENELRVFTWIVEKGCTDEEIKRLLDCYCKEYGTEAVAEWLMTNASTDIMARLNEVA